MIGKLEFTVQGPFLNENYYSKREKSERAEKDSFYCFRVASHSSSLIFTDLRFIPLEEGRTFVL